MSSVRKIAKQAGVSITTVSRALNNDASVSPTTREKILSIANRTGYVASVGRRVTTNIGFAYTGEQTISHPYDAAVLEGVASGVDEKRFDVMIIDIQRDKRADETFTQFFMRKGVRGVVIRTMARGRDMCREIAAEGFPHIVISERFDDDPAVCCIDCKSKPDSFRAVEYLISLGHKRIAFGVHNVPDRDHNDRLEGYREAMTKYGLSVREDYIFRQPYTLPGGATAMRLMMSMAERPTAIYFADPMLGVGAVKTAHEIGIRIPGDISIIGFDDTDSRFAVHPTLTAVCQDARALGAQASRTLIRRLADSNTEPVQAALSTFFEVNQSAGPPPDDSRASPNNRDASEKMRAERSNQAEVA